MIFKKFELNRKRIYKAIFKILIFYEYDFAPSWKSINLADDMKALHD